MHVHLLPPTEMETPTPATIDVEKQVITVTPNSKFKSTAPLIAGYVRVQGSSGAERKFVLLVSPTDGMVTAAEELPSQAAFDKLTAEEARKKVTPPKRDRSKKPTPAT